jgi:hypothetical protein
MSFALPINRDDIDDIIELKRCKERAVSTAAALFSDNDNHRWSLVDDP